MRCREANQSKNAKIAGQKALGHEQCLKLYHAVSQKTSESSRTVVNQNLWTFNNKTCRVSIL